MTTEQVYDLLPNSKTPPDFIPDISPENDPQETEATIENIVVRAGKSSDKNAFRIRVGVKGGGEFWRQNEVEFKCNSKAAHKRAEKWFKREYSGKQVRLISITYQ